MSKYLKQYSTRMKRWICNYFVVIYYILTEERFDYAKRLKQAVTDLQKVGEKLGKLDVEKRQSIENEDYDKAKLKKIQMDEYRLQVYKELNLKDLLELDRVN